MPNAGSASITISFSVLITQTIQLRQNHCKNNKCSSNTLLVEMTGVEPVSENKSAEASTGIGNG